MLNTTSFPKKALTSPGPRARVTVQGKKFAQVEFVAVMAALFRNHRVEPIPRSGETLSEARQHVLDVVKG